MPNDQALGQFILLSIPYQAHETAAPFPLPAAVLPNPVPPPLPNLDRLFGLCLDETEGQDYTGKWDFKGAAHSVARAIRIPYMYYRLGANGAYTLVVDYLLIGFEGGGSI